MGRDTLSRHMYTTVRNTATKGGTTRATHAAEEQVKKGKGIDPLVDPKGLSHLGPIRLSLPRFEKQGSHWLLTRGIPMPEETLLDTTGSMGDNVDLAFDALPHVYEMLTSGNNPLLGRYDVQIATANFNDVQDGEETPVLCRSQFEMDEKIAIQMALLVPGRNGCGNGKEDSQFGLFAAAYLTKAAINKYGLKWYHFTVSDEPTVECINFGWLKKIFGDDVLDHVKQNGYDFEAKNLPDTARAVKDLQSKAHAFFLQVNNRTDVTNQWTDLYGGDHVVMLPRKRGTADLHGVKAVIIGLTEGVLDLESAVEFLRERRIDNEASKDIVRAVAHIPLAAQTLFPNYGRLPKAGDLFQEKTDLWPVDAAESALPNDSADEDEAPQWL